jgi:L-serine deaminase
MYSVLMEGMHASRELPSKYDIKRKSARFFQRYRQNDDEQDLLMAAVYAVSEANAIGELVVSAPAYESCAILPGVLEYGEEICRFPHRQTIRSIAVAGLIGMLIATNSPTPEKTPNYQKELCSACAMTAAA